MRASHPVIHEDCQQDNHATHQVPIPVHGKVGPDVKDGVLPDAGGVGGAGGDVNVVVVRGVDRYSSLGGGHGVARLAVPEGGMYLQTDSPLGNLQSESVGEFSCRVTEKREGKNGRRM